MWDDTQYKVDDFIVKNLTLSIKISYPKDSNNLHWWLTAVYGSSKRENRGDFWMELEEIKSNCLPRWLMGGDFNIVRWQSETTAKNIVIPCMNIFYSFISRNIHTGDSNVFCMVLFYFIKTRQILVYFLYGIIHTGDSNVFGMVSSQSSTYFIKIRQVSLYSRMGNSF